MCMCVYSCRCVLVSCLGKECGLFALQLSGSTVWLSGSIQAKKELQKKKKRQDVAERVSTQKKLLGHYFTSGTTSNVI